MARRHAPGVRRETRLTVCTILFQGAVAQLAETVWLRYRLLCKSK